MLVWEVNIFFAVAGRCRSCFLSKQQPALATSLDMLRLKNGERTMISDLSIFVDRQDGPVVPTFCWKDEHCRCYEYRCDYVFVSLHFFNLTWAWGHPV